MIVLISQAIFDRNHETRKEFSEKALNSHDIYVSANCIIIIFSVENN